MNLQAELTALFEEFFPGMERFSVDQPRVPAGNPAGGQFASKGGSYPGYVPGSREKTWNTYRKGGTWDSRRAVAVHDAFVASVTEGVPARSASIVYMTGGGPASGKSTAILDNPDSGIPGKGEAAYVDADDAKTFIPEYNEGLAVGYKGAASQVSDESAYMSRIAIEKALSKSQHVVYDSVGGGGIDRIQGKVDNMRARGAKEIHANYATVDVEEGIRRADIRAEETGRYVPHSYIREAYADVARSTVQAINRGTFDSMKVFDTSGPSPKLIAHYIKGQGLKVHDEAAWKAHIKRGGY